MEPLTKDDLLAVFRSVVTPDFFNGLKDQAGGQGFDPYDAAAEMLARAASAINTTCEAYFILPDSNQTAAPGGGAVQATGHLTIGRVGSVAFDLRIPAGTLFVADALGPDGVVRDGIQVATTVTVTMSAGATQPVSVPCVAVRAGYQGNIPAGSVTRFVPIGTAVVPVSAIAATTITDTGAPDRFTQEMIGRYVRISGGPNDGQVRSISSVSTSGGIDAAFLSGAALTPGTADVAVVPEWADLGATVDQPEPFVGGRHAWLDANANERLSGRQGSETDDSLRYRIVRLADVVSPGAIQRIAARVLTPLGIPFKIVETRGALRGFILDFDALDFGDACGNGAVLVSEERSVRFFLICVGIGFMQDDPGFFMDVTTLPNGQINAMDAVVPLGNFMDGFSPAYLSSISTLWQMVDAARAAGVAFEITPDTNL